MKRVKLYPFEVSIIGVKDPIVIMACDVDDVYVRVSEQSDYDGNQIGSVIPIFSEREDCF